MWPGDNVLGDVPSLADLVPNQPVSLCEPSYRRGYEDALLHQAARRRRMWRTLAILGAVVLVLYIAVSAGRG
jgi:hypothetical protein